MEKANNLDGFAVDSAIDTEAGVQGVLRAVEGQLRELEEQRAEIMRRIGSGKKVILGLSTLFGDGILTDRLRELAGTKGKRKAGLTQECRTILMEANRAMSAQEVCQKIREGSDDLVADHKNPVASVSTILNRLVGYGEARRVALSSNRRGWQWIS